MDVLKAVFLAKPSQQIPVVHFEPDVLIERFIIETWEQKEVDKDGRTYKECCLLCMCEKCNWMYNPMYNLLSLTALCLWNMKQLPAHLSDITRTRCDDSLRQIRLYHDEGDEYTVAYFDHMFATPKDTLKSQSCHFVKKINKSRCMALN